MAMPPLLKILDSEENCVNILRKARFNDSVICPYCLSKKVIKWGSYRKVYQRYRCKDCP
ncbi:MAG: transposase [Armatimonadetes bacterium]|nr:transposase [Armatimonadota bacterium]